MKHLITLIALVATISQGVFIYLFLMHNKPGLTNFWLLCSLGVAYLCLFAYAAFSDKLAQQTKGIVSNVWLARMQVIALSAILVYIALDNLVFDYFQAISTSEPVIYAMLASWNAVLLLVVIALLQSFFSASNYLARSINLTAIAVLGLPVMILVSAITAPVANEKLSLTKDVFIGGEDGYTVYRIPAMLVIPKGATLSDNTTLANDRIIIMAEARRDGALDTGVIDLVQKISDDGGQTWGGQLIICQYIIDDMHGKCGNATPVFDSVSGKLILAYNLSGIPEDKAEAQRHHTSHVMTSNDGGLTWGAGTSLDLPNAVFGPGHGIQKLRAPYQNRLVIPLNTSVGGQGSSLAMYSDDHGVSWSLGDKLGTGNENELAEASNGDLLMATRHIAGIGKAPDPNGRLFSTSTDGGHSWSAPTLNTDVITPICQASLISANDGMGMYFLNPANVRARVHLTLRYSTNEGKDWSKSMLITPGPAGYSQLGQLSDDSIIMLYENGALSYSQQISFARLDNKLL